MKQQTLQNDILMRSIKILDIGYIAIIYISFALLLASVIDKIRGKFDEKKEMEKPFWITCLEMVITIWVYGIIIYIIRNIAPLIPFPLDGYQGYEHSRVPELKSASLFIFSFIIFCNYFREKVLFFYKRYLAIINK
jgi:hypothetical protein